MYNHYCEGSRLVLIQLDFMKKDEVTRSKIVKDYYSKLAKKSSKIAELNNWCSNNLDMKSLINTKHDSKIKAFEKIITADLQTLMKIKDYISKNNIIMDAKLKKYMLDTMYKNNIERIEFVNVLGVTVCPYCNRNFINSNKKTTNCQFDHFINKSSYPILAVSFYNLVPVCPSCNHIKSDKDFSYSPYDDSVNTDGIITFSYSLKGIDYLSDSSQLQVLLNTGSNKILDDNIKILGLNDLYQIHSDSIQELIKKKQIYTDEYVNQLDKNFGKLLNKDEIERLITGAYTSADDYGKRPLSKMITDISREIGLIKGK